MLDAIADSALQHGVDAAMNRAFHQGMDSDETGQLPGMDALKDAIRNARQEAIDTLHEALTPEGLSEASAVAGSPELEQLLNALQNRSATFASSFAGANRGTQTDLETLLNAGLPGETSEVIRDQLQRLIDLAELEQVVRRVRNVEDVDEIDPELLRTVAGDALAERFQQLTAGLQSIQEAGYVVRSGSRSTLSARAIQQIGESLLEQTLARIDARGWGDHRNSANAQSHDATGTSRQYRYGDPFDLDIAGSLLNAVRQSPGTPVRFNPDDLQVIERESSERATTVLAIDLSRSMGERGLLLVARKLALALSTWIRRRFPHDELHLIGFRNLPDHWRYRNSLNSNGTAMATGQISTMHCEPRTGCWQGIVAESGTWCCSPTANLPRTVTLAVRSSSTTHLPRRRWLTPTVKRSGYGPKGSISAFVCFRNQPTSETSAANWPVTLPAMC